MIRPVTPENTAALIEAQVVNRHAYLDTYPSGRHYVACGFPHPRRSFEGRCSVPVPHVVKHMNRDGNQWSGEAQCQACGCTAHVDRPCNGWVSNGWNQHGCHCQENR